MAAAPSFEATARRTPFGGYPTQSSRLTRQSRDARRSGQWPGTAATARQYFTGASRPGSRRIHQCKAAGGSKGAKGKAGKRVYFFGNGKAEGGASMKDLLGGKGANLAEMTSIGLPVPPGFTITTEICDRLQERPQAARGPDGRSHARTSPSSRRHRQEVRRHAKNPLLVSVRSAPRSPCPA